MNLLDRIDHRLADSQTNINPYVFEDCATSILSSVYPGLVPIPGGTDHGLDAEIDVDSEKIGLIITSSRTWDGARDNFRKSLESAKHHQLSVHRVIAVNLAQINRKRRESLKATANRFGCELMQVYDQAWFANQFYEHPDWRKKVLGIEDGTFSFTRQPSGARPEEHQLPTVGRQDLIEEIDASDSDLIIWGVPGVGKSHVAGKIKGALFLVKHNSIHRVLDDLIDAKPDFVIVDDAGGRKNDIEVLRQLRDSEKLRIKILAVCWPHEIEMIGDQLPGAKQLEVEQLTREELGIILRERGITRPLVLEHILSQADGRPAWALNLADLLVNEGDWPRAWSGQSIHDKVLSFLRITKAPDDAVEVLGTLALLGPVNENSLRRIAKLLQIREPELMRMIRLVATSGLIDVTESRYLDYIDGSSKGRLTYQVQPQLLAVNIASEVYFSAAPSPVGLDKVKESFPESASSILQSQVDAKLVGAVNARIPTIKEISAAFDSDEDVQLLGAYGNLSITHNHEAAQIYERKIREALDSENYRQAKFLVKHLAPLIADSVRQNSTSDLRLFVNSLQEITAKSEDIRPIVLDFVSKVCGLPMGDPPQFLTLRKLIEAFQQIPNDEVSDAVWIALTNRMFLPSFESSYPSPEVLNQVVFRPFAWSTAEMHQLGILWKALLSQRFSRLSSQGQCEVVQMMENWIRIALSRSIGFGGTVAEDQARQALAVASQIADLIGPSIKSPGVRSIFNRAAKKIGIQLHEPDLLFKALVREFDNYEDLEEELQRQDEAIAAALQPYMLQSPQVLMDWMQLHLPDLEMTRTLGPTYLFLVLSRQPIDNPTEWLEAAISHGLGRFASPLVESCVRNNTLTMDLLERLIKDLDTRGHLASAVVSSSSSSSLTRSVLDRLEPEDMMEFHFRFALEKASKETLKRLFTHKNKEVRGLSSAIWAAMWNYGIEATPQDPTWLNAIEDFTYPSHKYQDHFRLSLESIARTAPGVFMQLFVKHAASAERMRSIDLDDWKESTQLLSFEDRYQLWDRVCESELAPELFWTIAGTDNVWITEVLGSSNFTVPLRDLLLATQFQFGPRFPIEILAKMLLPLKPSPDEIIGTLEIGVFTGFKHERYASTLEKMKALSQSDDQQLAKIGQRGVEIYEPLLEKSLQEARRSAIKGTQL